MKAGDDSAALALGHATEAVATLAALMRDEGLTPAARISAANALLKWATVKGNGKGKGAQVVYLYWAPSNEGLT